MLGLLNLGFCLMVQNDLLHQNNALQFQENQVMHFLHHHIHGKR